MRAYEASGKTVEEAISEGLNKLNLSLGEVQVEILDEGSKGLFGLFGSKLARVRLTVQEDVDRETRSVFADSLDSYDARQQAPERAPRPAKPAREPKPAREREPRQEQAAKPAREPRAEKPVKEREPKAAAPAKAEEEQAEKPARKRGARKPRSQRERPAPQPVEPAEQKDPASLEGMVQGFLQKLTGLMGVEVSVAVHTDEEGNIRAVMNGDALGILIGRRGETLDALQYLCSLHLNRGREGYTRVTLDSEGYRQKREEALVRLANRMANRAQKTGRRVSLEPMNPYERRILHSALQHHPGITTHSEGEEPNRHVVITLSKDAPQDDAGQD